MTVTMGDTGTEAEAGRSPSGRAVAPSDLSRSAAQPEALIPSAEPLILIAKGDPEETPLLYVCAKCGSVHSPAIYLARKEVQHATALEAARDCYSCKTHNVCACGAECPKSWTACETCRFKKKFDAAVEVDDDGGPYFEFDGDRYYHDLSEAAADGVDWVCPTTVTYPRLDADSIFENLMDQMHEDASPDDLDATKKFRAAVARFNKAQTTASYWMDSKRKIRVPRDSDGSGEADETAETGSAVGDSAGPQDIAQPESAS